ncbi:MAG TPA: hypothetical protein VNJ51_13050 [Candidatus Dormibacteraeota bacterium]|nr:hypothetical protein [Candidatus Dormibacteraeota bacterium]
MRRRFLSRAAAAAALALAFAQAVAATAAQPLTIGPRTIGVTTRYHLTLTGADGRSERDLGITLQPQRHAEVVIYGGSGFTIVHATVTPDGGFAVAPARNSAPRRHGDLWPYDAIAAITAGARAGAAVGQHWLASARIVLGSAAPVDVPVRVSVGRDAQGQLELRAAGKQQGIAVRMSAVFVYGAFRRGTGEVRASGGRHGGQSSEVWSVAAE